MKGLLLKEWYQIRRGVLCILLLAALWIAVSLIGNADCGLSFLPLLLGVLPVLTVTQDDTSRFQTYTLTMPQSRKTVVTAKYLFALLTTVCSVLLAGIPMLIILGTADAGFLRLWLVFAVASALLIPLIMLPVQLCFGTETVSVIRFILMGAAVFVWIVFAGIPVTVFTHTAESELRPKMGMDAFAELLVMLGVLLTCSWYLAVRLYKRREF